ncbi:hypothetical protein NDU88_003893 [Pleurodeles waltl]|uniref:Uncharacterized protein n=1 Tax=Pleurodeles waltl TaxID=8319 RepID=A0AAV7RHX5_PLEWA|nr:hypothetical protein NDU88_003893 [Pleurodeles waltl]
MFGSHRGTPTRTLDACTEERACVIRTEPSSESARGRGRTARGMVEDRSRKKMGAEGGRDGKGQTGVDGGVREQHEPRTSTEERRKQKSQPRSWRDVATPGMWPLARPGYEAGRDSRDEEGKNKRQMETGNHPGH